MKRSQPGRRPLDDDDRSVGVHVKLPSKAYDDVWARAKRDRVSVPEIIRRDMRRAAQKRYLP